MLKPGPVYRWWEVIRSLLGWGRSFEGFVYMSSTVKSNPTEMSEWSKVHVSLWFLIRISLQRKRYNLTDKSLYNLVSQTSLLY